ncbi:hypothetical protein COOONC_07613 [Cooperia oncophora]
MTLRDISASFARVKSSQKKGALMKKSLFQCYRRNWKAADNLSIKPRLFIVPTPLNDAFKASENEKLHFSVVADIFDSPWTKKFKVQDDKRPPLSKYVEALGLVLFNQFVTAVIVSALFHYPMKFTGASFDKKLPDVTTVLAQIVFCVFIEEIGFYYSHRLV